MDQSNKNLILDGHKLAWHKDRVEAWLSGERIAPIEIEMALTRACNYKCKYCYGQLQENEETKMTGKVISRFLDDAAEIGVKAIALIGDGESQCSPYLYDTISRGKQNGIDMALGTNGALLKKEKLEEMLPDLTYIRFNFSAGEKKIYEEIHGCREKDFENVCEIIRESSRIKRHGNLGVTIGMQMVLLPEFIDQAVPLAKLGEELGADYLVIKHCSDDEEGRLGVDYNQYFEEKLVETLKRAETFSTSKYLVKAKWSKILSGGERKYSQCYGPPFMLQMSGSGLVAPCGPLFNSQYSQYHIGNITRTPFKEIWQSDRYWEVMDLIASDKFDARKMCGKLCFQHKVNEYLWDLKTGAAKLGELKGNAPQHVNFI